MDQKPNEPVAAEPEKPIADAPPPELTPEELDQVSGGYTHDL